MLNPSTADATVNDPTIRRCLGFAHTWDYGGMVAVNLFAYRATHPRALDALLSALHDPDPRVALAAIEALSLREAAPAARRELERLSFSGDPEIAEAALEALEGLD